MHSPYLNPGSVPTMYYLLRRRQGFYDIDFRVQGLSFTHLTTATISTCAQESETGINIADFSRSNKRSLAQVATSLHQIISSVQT